MEFMHEVGTFEETIQNEWYTVSVDNHGRLIHLERRGSGYGNIVCDPGPGLFRAVLKNKENWEDVAGSENQRYAIRVEGNTIFLTTGFLQTRDRKASVEVTLVISLDGKKIVFEADIKNNEDGLVTDVYYPCVGGISTLKGGKPSLLWPDCAGQKIDNIAESLGSQGEWGGPQVLKASYPGSLSMQWMSLVDDDEVLYYAGHDSLFHTSSLRVVSIEALKGRQVLLETDKMAFVRQGETWHCPSCILSLYKGTWREGADEYVSWCKTWRKPVKKIKWAQDMNGYFLVIAKQQYGDELWDYASLPSLYDYAKTYGCDVLGLFGWFDSGHDNQYPDLTVSLTLGGAEVLKQKIREIQADGGRITLYYQGHLMDVKSKFYEEKGKELEGRNIWDTPYYEDYSKSHASDFLSFFSKKKFSTVCPSCTEWHDLMVEKAKWVASFGPDGILYDQIGGMPSYPCFNEKHQHMHNRPSLSYTQGRLALLKKIHDQARTLGDEFIFMTEHETDVYSQFPDILHGIGICPPSRNKMKKAGDSWTSLSSSAPQMFRYCFPEIIMTLRNPNPFLDRRYVNYAIAFGFRFEMEIRYLGDRQVLVDNEQSEMALYARKAGALRRKYKDMLLEGLFRDQENIQNENPQVYCSLFEGKARSCLVLWNDTVTTQTVSLSYKNKTITGWETIDANGEGIPKEIDGDTFMILLLA
ncbi:hypothetical protein SpiGrapes_1590 [Sphaerochaeta pleomorpha str. Grapes]|uniref:DUF6259 domain-containing protein n=1 Tax=Sphaerochaeta pleomorpha (strain ATCC BAA-1885 / DSM 22778 / Grapes) TaxID=158190 RepID=G8QW99_SPHPG|nr:DUF6259 domain-containing protein [Sphaerochaeta pleomorpha]AEV29397.1 hypothetical protein SpiGrapes_1590 [Sphaerochaeta pleomorpha str. Grapes]